VRVVDGDTHLAVWTRHGDATVVVPGGLGETDPAAYRGRCIRVVGVLVPGFDGRGERVVERGPTIYAAARPRVTDAPAGLAAPLVALADELRRFVPDPHPAGRRVTVAGVATAVGAWNTGHIVMVQDGDAGVRVECDGPAAVRAGDRVAATGFLTVRGRRMRLRQAVAVAAGPAPVAPAPATSTPGWWPSTGRWSTTGRSAGAGGPGRGGRGRPVRGSVRRDDGRRGVRRPAGRHPGPADRGGDRRPPGRERPGRVHPVAAVPGRHRRVGRPPRPRPPPGRRPGGPRRSPW